MIYVALLRGINVGGNNKVEMKKLKATFESLGLSNVTTYINSGNVIFVSKNSPEKLVIELAKAIENDFGFAVKVLLRSFDQIKVVNKALPSSWLNNQDMKCDVMFLWPEVDSEKILSELTIKKDIDEVKYVAGTILWRVDRDKVTRSGLMKLAGTPLYKQMTIRNCNTARKLLELMQKVEE